MEPLLLLGAVLYVAGALGDYITTFKAVRVEQVAEEINVTLHGVSMAGWATRDAIILGLYLLLYLVVRKLRGREAETRMAIWMLVMGTVRFSTIILLLFSAAGADAPARTAWSIASTLLGLD